MSAGSDGCYASFEPDYNDPSRCYYVGWYTLSWTSAESECKLRTNNEGYLAEPRDPFTRDFLLPRMTLGTFH